MKVTAITRFKHGDLYAVLGRIGWNQAELARRTGLNAGTVGDIINLVRRPTTEQCDAIQKAVGSAGEYLDVLAEWPETFSGLKRGCKLEQTAEVDAARLIGCREALALPAQEPTDTSELDAELESALNSLPPSEKQLLIDRFWNNATLEEAGVKHGLGREGVRCLQNRALRRLRHPKIMRALTQHMSNSVF